MLDTGLPVRDLVVGRRGGGSGDWTWALAGAYAELTPQGEVSRVVVTFTDITERRQALARQRHLTEVLRAIRNVNQLITQEKDRDTLLRRACGLLTETRGYPSAWIGLRDASGRLHVAAESGIGGALRRHGAQVESGTWPLVLSAGAVAAGYRGLARPVRGNAPSARWPTRTTTWPRWPVRCAPTGRDYGVLVAALPAHPGGRRGRTDALSGDHRRSRFCPGSHGGRGRAQPAADALSESEAQFRGTFEQAAVGMAHVDLEGRWIRVNGRLCDILGCSREELLGTTFLEVTHSEDQEADRAAQRGLLAGELETYAREKRYIRKDRSIVPIALTVSLSRGPSGEPRYFIAVVQDITARKRAEESLRISEERFRSIVVGAPDAIFIQTHGTFAYLNPAACRLFGVASQDELVGSPIVDRIHPDYREGARERIRRLNEDRASVTDLYQQRFLRVDGSEVWVETAGEPIVHEGRDGALVFVRDISQRVLADAAARESMVKLEAALSSMTDAVFISDTDGKFIDFNEAFATFHRFPSKDECARTLAEYPGFLDVFLPGGELVPLDQWAVPRALRGETVTNAEYTLRRKDTGETWVGSYSFAPIRDASGIVVGSVVVGRDITELKRAEVALRESEDRFRALVDGAPDGIFVQSEERFLFLNPAMLR